MPRSRRGSTRGRSSRRRTSPRSRRSRRVSRRLRFPLHRVYRGEKWTDVGNDCHIKQIRTGSDKYKSYGCFVTAKQCDEGGWLSKPSTAQEGTPAARFFQVLKNGCTKKAPEPQEIDENEFNAYMDASPATNKEVIRRAVHRGPYFKHKNGVVVIEPLPQYTIPSNDKVRQNSCILSALISDSIEDSWGGEYLFSFAVEYARKEKMNKMFFQPEYTIPLTVWDMWCKREGLVLKHSEVEYVNKILEGKFNNQYGLLPVITMYFNDNTEITLTYNKSLNMFDLKDKTRTTRLSLHQAKRYVNDNWKITIACSPTMDESGFFFYHDGQVAENTFWVTLRE